MLIYSSNIKVFMLISWFREKIVVLFLYFSVSGFFLFLLAVKHVGIYFGFDCNAFGSFTPLHIFRQIQLFFTQLILHHSIN